jgi:hypothetical protein
VKGLLKISSLVFMDEVKRDVLDTHLIRASLRKKSPGNGIWWEQWFDQEGG